MCVKSTKKTQQNRRCTYLSPPNQQTHKIQYLRKVASTRTESATCFVSGLQDGQDDFFYTIWKIFNDAKCEQWKNELMRFKRKGSFSSWLYPFYIHSSSCYWMKIKKTWVGLVSGNVTIVIRIDILATQLHPTAGINNASAGKCKILQTVVNGHERARALQNIKKKYQVGISDPLNNCLYNFEYYGSECRQDIAQIFYVQHSSSSVKLVTSPELFWQFCWNYASM